MFCDFDWATKRKIFGWLMLGAAIVGGTLGVVFATGYLALRAL